MTLDFLPSLSTFYPHPRLFTLTLDFLSSPSTLDPRQKPKLCFARSHWQARLEGDVSSDSSGFSSSKHDSSASVTATTLLNIFNLSLQTAIFPDDWKFAKVSPIFQEGNKSDCGNYRSISVANIFEKLIY